MALNADRNQEMEDISYFMNEKAEAGGIVSAVLPGASGVALDNPLKLATYAANPSGARPLGILLCDVVDKDLSKDKLNPYREERIKGGKVTILRKGWVVTNMILGNPTPESPAYVGPSGLLSTTPVGGNTSVVAVFRTGKSVDGFAEVEVNFPLTGR